jgi:hypothetical protein
MVEKTTFNLFLLHSSDMEAFHLVIYISEFVFVESSKWNFTCQSIWKWVWYATSKNVQILIACGSTLISPIKKILPSFLFYSTHLTTVTLYNYILTPIPIHFSGFNHLVTCSFMGMEFKDDSLSYFISHTSFLENRSIFYYIGLMNSLISTPNLKHEMKQRYIVHFLH